MAIRINRERAARLETGTPQPDEVHVVYNFITNL